jgi:hypothetical protein
LILRKVRRWRRAQMRTVKNGKSGRGTASRTSPTRRRLPL